MTVDLNTTMLTFQLMNIVLLGTWLFLVVVALRRLQSTPLAEGVKLGWAALILLVPVLGALAFLSTRARPNPPTAS